MMLYYVIIWLEHGGIKPSITSDTKIERKGKYEAVSNYLCVDIPSSGYIISWTWDSSDSGTKEAIYDARSMKTTISGNSYETTESGTIKLKGSFSNLNFKLLNNNSNLKVKIDDNSKIVKICNINNEKYKNKFGNAIKGEWLTGNDGRFIIPADANTYKSLEITIENDNYVTNDSNYYLKAVLFGKDINFNDIYNAEPKKLSEICETNGDGDYYLCPRFGARNYILNNKYYHESLEEVFKQIANLEDKECTIKVLKDITIANVAWNIYAPKHDPSYGSTNVTFNSSNKVINLDLNGKKIRRKTVIKLNSSKLKIGSSISSDQCGLFFEQDGTNFGLYLTNDAEIYLDNGAKITNSKNAVISLNGNSKFYGIKGTVETTKDGSAAIVSAAGTEINLGNDNNGNNSNLIIKSSTGLAINAGGKLVWKYGTLKTKSIVYKRGYNAGSLSIENNTYKPCLEKTGDELISTLQKADWKWTDNDSGNSSYIYYAYKLQNAVNCLNLKDDSNEYTIEWINPTTNSGEINNATINKKLIINFNCIEVNRRNKGVPYFTNTSLTISSQNVKIKNLYSEYKSKNGAGIKVNENASLNIENCLIGVSGQDSYGINIANKGSVTYDSSNVATDSNLGFYSSNGSNERRCGFYSKSNGKYAINNIGKFIFNVINKTGTISNYNECIYTESSSYAIFNNGTDVSKAEFYYNGKTNITNSIYSNSNARYIVENLSKGYFKVLNGKMEAKNASNTNISSILTNSGDYEINNGILIANYTDNNSSNSFAINNSNKLKIYGTSKIQSYGRSIQTNSGSNTYIYDSASIISNYTGINNSGNVYVFSGYSGSTMQNLDTASKGPTIAGKTYGIYIVSSGMVTVGVNESPSSKISKSYPIIKSNNIGINITNNSICNFFDGAIYIKSGSGSTIKKASSGTINYPSGHTTEQTEVNEILFDNTTVPCYKTTIK